MRLAVGDPVVYGQHGAGAIVARATRDVLGERQEVVAIALAGDLSVELPLARAEQHLRPVADETEIRRVRDVLSAGSTPSGFIPTEWAHLQSNQGLLGCEAAAVGASAASP